MTAGIERWDQDFTLWAVTDGEYRRRGYATRESAEQEAAVDRGQRLDARVVAVRYRITHHELNDPAVNVVDAEIVDYVEASTPGRLNGVPDETADEVTG